MQVADIISWSLGIFACFHKREVSSACIRVCVYVCVRERKQDREKKVSKGHNKKLAYSLRFQMYKTKHTHTLTHTHVEYILPQVRFSHILCCITAPFLVLYNKDCLKISCIAPCAPIGCGAVPVSTRK